MKLEDLKQSWTCFIYLDVFALTEVFFIYYLSIIRYRWAIKIKKKKNVHARLSFIHCICMHWFNNFDNIKITRVSFQMTLKRNIVLFTIFVFVCPSIFLYFYISSNVPPSPAYGVNTFHFFVNHICFQILYTWYKVVMIARKLRLKKTSHKLIEVVRFNWRWLSQC